MKNAARRTRDMVGLLLSPANAAPYKALAIACDGIEIRKEIWGIVVLQKNAYLRAPSLAKAQSMSLMAVRIGHFSIWMEVFRERKEVRKELIRTFKADPQCFSRNSTAKKKGRV